MQQHWLKLAYLKTQFLKTDTACKSHASRISSAPQCMLGGSCLAGSIELASSCTASAPKEADTTSHLQCLLASRQSAPSQHVHTVYVTQAYQVGLETCAALSSSVCASDHALLPDRSCPNKAARPLQQLDLIRARTAAWQRFC